MKVAAFTLLLIPTSLAATMNHTPLVKQALIQAAESTEVPLRLLSAICYTESGFRIKAIKRHDGDGHSYGLCQIKEATARDMGFTGNVKDLFDPFINTYYSGKYLKYQLDRYDQDWVSAISAYNAGHRGYKVKNKKYVNKVLNHVLRF